MHTHTPPQSVIWNLETHNLRTNKEQIILEEAKSNNTVFFEGCKLALDPMITFGVKQVPEHKSDNGPGCSWHTFRTNVQRLINREMTGNAARELIEDMMNHSTKDQWNNWYRRILIKDLRCGVSEKTINKVVEKEWHEYAIPVFSCQLAHDSANHEEKLTGEKLIEVKLDGVRVLTIVYPDGNVTQFTRNGKELLNFENIKEQFKKTVVGLSEPCVFDGEVMSSSFQDLMKQIHRKENVKTDDATLYLFDYIPLSNFLSGSWNKPQVERTKKLDAWKDLWNEETPNIQILEHEFVDLDTEEGKDKFKEINTQAVEGGYEGIMIKNTNAPYECKRTHNWLKMKPFIEVSLEVADVEEGTGRNVGRLGALVCAGSELGKNISVNVGSGFSDNDRIDFWNNRSKLIGQIVEVRADAITMNQDGSYSLRFPRFKSFRGFKPGEKI